MAYPYANPSDICNTLSRVFTKVEVERKKCEHKAQHMDFHLYRNIKRILQELSTIFQT
jgi:hypothetical protein